MKTSHLLIALLVCRVSIADAQQAQVTLSRATAQTAAGIVAIPVGAMVGLGIGGMVGEMVSSDSEHVGQTMGMLAGGALGAAVGPAFAVRAVGTGGAPHGNGLAAFGGALAGYAVDFAIGKLTHKTGLDSPSFLVNLVAPAVGATLAYDLLR